MQVQRSSVVAGEVASLGFTYASVTKATVQLFELLLLHYNSYDFYCKHVWSTNIVPMFANQHHTSSGWSIGPSIEEVPGDMTAAHH